MERTKPIGFAPEQDRFPQNRRNESQLRHCRSFGWIDFCFSSGHDLQTFQTFTRDFCPFVDEKPLLALDPNERALRSSIYEF